MACSSNLTQFRRILEVVAERVNTTAFVWRRSKARANNTHAHTRTCTRAHIHKEGGEKKRENEGERERVKQETSMMLSKWSSIRHSQRDNKCIHVFGVRSSSPHNSPTHQHRKWGRSLLPGHLTAARQNKQWEVQLLQKATQVESLQTNYSWITLRLCIAETVDTRTYFPIYLNICTDEQTETSMLLYFFVKPHLFSLWVSVIPQPSITQNKPVSGPLDGDTANKNVNPFSCPTRWLCVITTREFVFKLHLPCPVHRVWTSTPTDRTTTCNQWIPCKLFWMIHLFELFILAVSLKLQEMKTARRRRTSSSYNSITDERAKY